MRGSAWSVAMVAAILTSLPAVAARAEVIVSIPSGCGSEQAFREELNRLVVPESGLWNALSARIDAHNDGGFRLIIHTPAGKRELFDSDCRALYRAALVILAAQDSGATAQAGTVHDPSVPARTDPLAPVETPQDPSVQVETTQDPSVGVAKAPPEQSRTQDKQVDGLRATRNASAAPRTEPTRAKNNGTQRRPQRPSYLAFLGAGVEWGLAPAVKGTGALGMGLQFRRWGMQWELRGTPPTSHQTVGEVGLRVYSLGTRLAASWDPVEIFHLLFGVSVSSLRASGIGLPEQDSDQVFLPALEGELQLRPFRFRHWGLELDLRARYGLIRPAFEVDPEVTVFEAPRWGGAALFRTIYFF